MKGQSVFFCWKPRRSKMPRICSAGGSSCDTACSTMCTHNRWLSSNGKSYRQMQVAYKQEWASSQDCVFRGFIPVKQVADTSIQTAYTTTGFRSRSCWLSTRRSPASKKWPRKHTSKSLRIAFLSLFAEICRQHLHSDLDDASRSTPAVSKHRYPTQKSLRPFTGFRKAKESSVAEA
jgi:hypothetical protein